MTDEELKHIEALVDAATTEPLQRNLYDHGGGRMFRDGESGARKLVLDAYSEDDREFYFAALANTRSLLAEVRRLQAELAAAGRWISVKERQPQHTYEHVVTVSLESGQQCRGYFNGVEWRIESIDTLFGWGFATSDDPVAYWHELPPAPPVFRRT